MVEVKTLHPPTFWQRRGSPAVTRLYSFAFRQMNREEIAEEILRKAKDLQPNQKILLMALLITHKLIQPKFSGLDPEDLRPYHFRKILSREQIEAFDKDFAVYVSGRIRNVEYYLISSEVIVAGGESKAATFSDHFATATVGYRKKNGDALAIVRPSNYQMVFAVADGMGGHGYPEKDSMILLHALVLLIKRGMPLDEAVQKILALELKTTLVAAEITDGNKLKVYHYGDSRAFLIKKNDSIVLLTEDHKETIDEFRADHPSAVWPLNDPGEYYDYSRRSNDQTIISGPYRKTDEIILEEGDRLLLCTDGIDKLLAWEGFKALFASSHSASNIITALIEALKQSISDDTTVILFEYHLYT